MQVMKSLWLMVFMLSAAALSAQQPALVWAGQFTGPDAEGGYHIRVLPDKSVVISGEFNGTVDFDPDTGVIYNLTSTSLGSMFIEKFSATGQFAWAKGLNGVSGVYNTGMATDDAGNVYAAGRFRDTMDVNPGAGVQTLYGAGTATLGGTSYDAFLLKLDTAGNFGWAIQYAGLESDGILDMLVDKDNNVNVLLGFSGVIDVELGAGITNIGVVGELRTAILKYNEAGDLLLASVFGGPGGGLQLDKGPQGEYVVFGKYLDTIDVNPQGGYLLYPDGVYNHYLLKLDSTGTFIWAKSWSSVFDTQFPTAVRIDNLGNIIATGVLRNTADFDPSDCVWNLTSLGDRNTYIQRFDPDGNLIWAKVLEGTDNVQINNLKLDDYGNLYIVGGFDSMMDFDYSAGVNMVQVNGSAIFFSKLDPTGNQVWTYMLGGDAANGSGALALDNTGGIYLTGYFQLNVDFDLDTSEMRFNSQFGSSDGFVAKYQICQVSDTISRTAYSSYNFFGTTYTKSGSYRHCRYSGQGCDTTSVLYLTITHPPVLPTLEDTVTICQGQQYLIGGAYRTVSGTYFDTLITVNCVDTAAMVHLIVEEAPIAPEITMGENHVLSVPDSFTSYQWYKNGVRMQFFTNDSTAAVIGNSYSVVVTNAAGCADTSATFAVTGVGEVPNAWSLHYYPNPTEGKIYLEISGAKTAEWWLYNNLGQLIMEGATQSATANIDLTKEAEGIYYLKVKVGNEMVTKKVVRL